MKKYFNLLVSFAVLTLIAINGCKIQDENFQKLLLSESAINTLQLNQYKNKNNLQNLSKEYGISVENFSPFKKTPGKEIIEIYSDKLHHFISFDAISENGKYIIYDIREVKYRPYWHWEYKYVIYDTHNLKQLTVLDSLEFAKNYFNNTEFIDISNFDEIHRKVIENNHFTFKVYNYENPGNNDGFIIYMYNKEFDIHIPIFNKRLNQTQLGKPLDEVNVYITPDNEKIVVKPNFKYHRNKSNKEDFGIGQGTYSFGFIVFKPRRYYSDIYYNQAINSIRAEKLRDSVLYFRKSIYLYPLNVKAFYYAGACYIRLGNIAEGIRFINKAFQIDKELLLKVKSEKDFKSIINGIDIESFLKLNSANLKDHLAH